MRARHASVLVLLSACTCTESPPPAAPSAGERAPATERPAPATSSPEREREPPRVQPGSEEFKEALAALAAASQAARTSLGAGEDAPGCDSILTTYSSVARLRGDPAFDDERTKRLTELCERLPPNVRRCIRLDAVLAEHAECAHVISTLDPADRQELATLTSLSAPR